MIRSELPQEHQKDDENRLEMTHVLEGVKVVEVTLWGFVASTGTVLADWGAEVCEIEHPDRGTRCGASKCRT